LQIQLADVEGRTHFGSWKNYTENCLQLFSSEILVEFLKQLPATFSKDGD